METHPCVLVVEDDAAIRNLIATTLDVNGYRHREATGGEQALRELTSSPNIDLVILDLGLPDIDGVDVIRSLRRWSHTPIIVVSARLEDSDKVEALDAGADDYLVKPFSVDELLARLRVAIRRLSYMDSQESEAPIWRNGDIEINRNAGNVTVRGEEVHLTPIEFRLLCLLAKKVGKVLTPNFILKEVWGAALANDLPSLRVFMATLRKKIELDPSNPEYIQTRVGIGYCMMRVDRQHPAG